MVIRYGTSYFISAAATARYYRPQYGYEYAAAKSAVASKIACGEIHIGKPPLKSDGSERWVLIDNGTRYAIEDSQ